MLAVSAGVTAFPDNITNQIFHLRGSADMREYGHGSMGMHCPRLVDFAGDIFVHMPSCGKKVRHDANVRGAFLTQQSIASGIDGSASSRKPASTIGYSSFISRAITPDKAMTSSLEV